MISLAAALSQVSETALQHVSVYNRSPHQSQLDVRVGRVERRPVGRFAELLEPYVSKGQLIIQQHYHC